MNKSIVVPVQEISYVYVIRTYADTTPTHRLLQELALTSDTGVTLTHGKAKHDVYHLSKERFSELNGSFFFMADAILEVDLREKDIIPKWVKTPSGSQKATMTISTYEYVTDYYKNELENIRRLIRDEI